MCGQIVYKNVSLLKQLVLLKNNPNTLKSAQKQKTLISKKVLQKLNKCSFGCSPPARWGLLDFIRAVLLLLASCPPLPPSPRPPPPPSPPPPPPPVSPPPPLPPLPCPLPPCQLFAKLFASFPVQCAPLDLNLRAAQLSVHCWTSTCELPSSVCTAGPQPGSCPAQCAPLDLNRGPAQLSVHRWTSTGDLPSSVCTAGPQPGTCPAQCAPLNLNLGPAQLSVHHWTSTAR